MTIGIAPLDPLPGDSDYDPTWPWTCPHCGYDLNPYNVPDCGGCGREGVKP